MKLSELAAEVSDPTPEQIKDYQVVIYDMGNDEEWEADDVKWDHNAKKLVISI